MCDLFQGIGKLKQWAKKIRKGPNMRAWEEVDLQQAILDNVLVEVQLHKLRSEGGICRLLDPKKPPLNGEEIPMEAHPEGPKI